MFSSVWNSEIPSQTIRERQRMIGQTDSHLIRHAMRVIRWRKRRADLQETLGYHRDKTGFCRAVNVSSVSTVESVPVEQWAIAHNASLDQSAIEKSRQWRESRIQGIRHVQAVRKLERAIAKYHRRTSTPIETPVSTLASHPLPAIKLAGDDTTESEILELLATIRNDDRRADVRAECWIVRSAHPSAPAKHVFNRALKTCQMVSRGIYSERERKRIERKGIPSNAVGEPMHSKAVQYWQDTCEQLNKAEREQLAVVIARSSLGQEILTRHLAGKTYAQIAREMGVTERTIYRRFAALEQKPSVEWSTERNSVFVRTA